MTTDSNRTQDEHVHAHTHDGVDVGERAAGNLSRDTLPDTLRDVVPAAAPTVGVVIVAGGSGTRVGGDELKQFRWVAGKPMVLHSLQTFQLRPDVALVVVVLPRDFAADPPPWIFQCDIDRLLVSQGGRDRMQSVYNGLEDMPENIETVVIHDAARPLASGTVIDRVIREARNGHGAIAALPVVDTLKEVDADGRIVRTIDRTNLWRAQTPQAFPRAMIDEVHTRARRDRLAATDDAALCEHYGFPVVVVRGSERGMKVTEAGDFVIAESLSMLSE
ncbi:MAG: 2-C-methyl-D-erythritol 4-phosphate cytidylyltransferase [Gemmatimonadaceae bacterium]|nr:2-C-methyl-D-erythritol 4-phosphate cytidylyltransferase [Gemmatimonadaceae bacterium]